MMMALLGALALTASPVGAWRAALDLAGGELRFALIIDGSAPRWTGRVCNGGSCEPLSNVQQAGDTLLLEIGDYAAGIRAVIRGDSLIGFYHNVGRKGPRTIPFRASRGRWPNAPGPAALLGRWDAWLLGGFDQSPRVLEFRNGPEGLEGTVISNSGDAGLFWGSAAGDSLAIGHFDGSFVYLLTGRLDGDTLRGTFHAGLTSEVPVVATRSTGQPHLTPPTEVTRTDTSRPFGFDFPDLDGHPVRSTDERFRNKAVLLEIFGTWCPTCHDAAPLLVQLYNEFHSRGLEIVGVAFEVTGDTAQDAPLVRRFRDKFHIPFPLLLGGASDADIVSASFPALDGFAAFPTTLFIGRDGRVRRIHAGFYGPATGAAYDGLVSEFRREVGELVSGER